MMLGRTMEIMAAAGKPPTVFMSVNSKGGKEYYDKVLEQFQQRGY